MKELEKHKYNLIQNIVYVYRGVAKHKPYLIILMLISMISTCGARFVWLFLGKYLIEYIANGIEPLQLFKIVVKMAILNLLCMLGQNIVSYGKEPAAYYVRPMFMLMRNKKHISMMYEKLEYNQIQDAMQKSKYSTSNMDKGIEGLIRYTISLASEIVTCTVALVLLFQMSPLLIPIVILVGTVSYYFINSASLDEKRMTQDEVSYENRKKEYFQNVCRNFAYGKDIRLYGVRNTLMNEIWKLNYSIHQNVCKARNKWKASKLFNNTLGIFRESIMYYLLIRGIITGILSVGDFLLYTGCVNNFARSYQDVLMIFAKMKRCSKEVDDYRFYNAICDSENNGDGKRDMNAKEFSIVFDHVSYRYPNSERFALKDINLTIPFGQRLAVVGLNGAGKTTFIKLLQRLYDPTEGTIYINGVDYRTIDRKKLYSLYSTVFQDMECYAFSLAENISMQAEAHTDKGRVEQCIRETGLGNKLDTMALGVDTPVLKLLFDNGFVPSGGEKQKMALARALYKDAQIIILDEPTAALDAMAESQLYEKFAGMTENKMAIYISHRLASTKFCDVIALFEDGRIVEYGTHTELMNLSGKYAELFSLQANYYNEEAV